MTNSAVIRVEPVIASSCEMLAGIDQHWPPPRLDAILRRPAGAGLMAIDEGQQPPAAIGFIIGFVTGGEAEIIQITVSESYRRRGVGLSLLARFLEAHVMTCCYLELRADNMAARNLYESAGFRTTGRRKGYYRIDATEAGRIDAVLMGFDRTLDRLGAES